MYEALYTKAIVLHTGPVAAYLIHLLSLVATRHCCRVIALQPVLSWNRDWARLSIQPSSLYARVGASTGPGPPKHTYIKVWV